MLNRNLLRHRFAQWSNNTFYINSLEDAVWKSSKTLQRHKVKSAFLRYKKKVQEMKRLDYVKNKVNWFGDVRDKKVLEDCMDCWKTYIKRYQNAKKFLVRSIKGVDNLIANEAFSKWKNHMYTERK